jgi:omega-amidase
MKITLSLAQINLSISNTEKNFEKACHWIDDSANCQSHIVLFPELWSSGYDLQNCAIYGQENLTILDSLNKISLEKSIWIGGSVIDARYNQFFNTFYLFSPNEQPPIKYDKIHLFRLLEEDQWFSPGAYPVISDLPWGRTGLATCYDLRFPGLFQWYALHGAQIILLVSEWPIQRIDHWKTLLRARAIENQIFIAAVNAVGKIGEATYGGSSAVISPWGEIIAEGSASDEELITTTIDMDEVEFVRKRIPVFKDRRPDIYGM